MPKPLLLKALCAPLLAIVLLSGCGYHPVTLRGPLAEANGVNVTVFANKSYRRGPEGTLARDLIDEFALRTGGKVLPAEEAQLELIGTITQYSTVPVSYTALNTIEEYRTTMTVQATLREQLSKKVLWKGDLTRDQTFPVNTNLALQQNGEEAAVAMICRRLSEDIWRKVGEMF